MIYELETIATLPVEYQRHVPPLDERRSLLPRSVARLCVIVNGAYAIAPWVEVVEVTPKGYVGKVGGYMNSPDWKPYGELVEFTAENVIAI